MVRQRGPTIVPEVDRAFFEHACHLTAGAGTLVASKGGSARSTSHGVTGALDTVLARTFLSCARDAVRSRTAAKKYYEGLRISFSNLHFRVHENIGVLVDNDMVALRTIITGLHTGE